MPNIPEIGATATQDFLMEKCLSTPFNEWPKNLTSALAARLEDSILHPRKAAIEKEHDRLNTLLNLVLTGAPQEVKAAVINLEGDPQLRAAYLLGQLSFAQELAATVLQHKPDDAFYAVFKDAQALKILSCLQKEPSSKVQIATAQGIPLTVLDLKMKELLSKGIIDFRIGGSQGSVAEYFLTPAAEAMMKEQTSPSST